MRINGNPLMFESPLIQLEIQMLIKAKWLNKEINAIMGKKLQYIIMQVQIWSSIEKYWEKKKKEGNKHKKQNESALSKICLIKSHWTCWKSFIKFDTNFLCAFLDFTISCLLYSLRYVILLYYLREIITCVIPNLKMIINSAS